MYLRESNNSKIQHKYTNTQIMRYQRKQDDKYTTKQANKVLHKYKSTIQTYTNTSTQSIILQNSLKFTKI